MKRLIVIAWIAPVAAIPAYFLAEMGLGMSATASPHATAGELLILAAGPCVSVGTIVAIVVSGRVKPFTAGALVIPGLLSLVELAFTIRLWQAG